MKNFKDSGIEWLREIPQNWEIVPIRYCFNEFNVRCNDNNYPLLSVTIANGVVYQNDITNKKDTSNDDKSNYKIVPIGAIAYNKMRMWQGAVGINMLEKGIVSPAYVVAIPNKQINISFSYYLLKSKNMISEYEKYSYGLCSDMNNLRYEDFQNIKIPLPPLKEQEQIANFLDEKCEQIKNFIEKKEKLIILLKEQKQAFINEVTTKGLGKNVNFKDSSIEYLGEIPQHWEVRKLKYITYLRNQKNNNIDFKIGLENIESKTGKYIPTSEMVFEEDGIEFKSGDILFGKLRPYLAKVFLANKNGICVSEFLVLKIKSESNKFIKFLMLSSLFIDIVDGSTYGTKMPRASWEFIGNLKIPLPPLKEQEQIAKFLDEKCEKIDLLIEKTEKQIKLIKEYKTTLINQAVCGRISL
ncbi:restriction endonuclease subunit S [Campylobacter volucris]|uniref:restriction endonuclease subunit S n=1 Tax=Campylobacter volucris TaxID=1031542 RepID=UPI00189FF779|nr:restriction endonuclease subunit S [Campylobacter volucris]MBF7045926.1 restriction endonuclease subunit S [Campylobacter volucris]